MNTTITRFAPSPTGTLHLGNIRAALFSWIHAKQNNGKFILRIDDTDKQRNSEIYIKNIIKIINWLELYPDYPPIFQSKRLEIYNKIAIDLISQNKAYKCYCDEERIKLIKMEQLKKKENPKYDNHCRNLNLNYKNKNFVIRFKNPIEGNVKFNDIIKGTITISNTELDDFVIIRTNSLPTYNYASVIDDAEMKITEIIRGDDHIPNTPKQINLFKALNVTIPKFAHLPMILNKNKKPLSKRENNSYFKNYENTNILPEALINYILKLGWSYKDKEIFTKTEILNLFKIENINKSPSMFDLEKLLWFNRQFIKKMNIKDIISALEPIRKKHDLDHEIDININDLIHYQINRINTIEEIITKNEYLFKDHIKIEKQLYEKHVSKQKIEVINKLIEILKKESFVWEIKNIKSSVTELCSNYEIQLENITIPIRLAITGTTDPGPTFEIIFLSGKNIAIKKLEIFTKHEDK